MSIRVKASETFKYAHIKKGAIMINKFPGNFNYKRLCVKYFDVRVRILQTPNTIAAGYQAVIHTGGIRATIQAVQVGATKDGIMRSNEEGVIRFKFKYGVEYIEEGAKILMRETTTQGFGIVNKIFPMMDPPEDLVDRFTK